jgi:hypothetical protein
MSINIQYKTDIGIPYGQLNEVIKWCVDNLEHDWKYIVLDYGGKDPGHYEFIFDDEKDFIKFMLVKK